MCFKREDTNPGCSQQRSTLYVRLQSTPRRVTTRKGRRQTADDEVPQLSHSWFRSDRRADRSSPGTEVAFETEVECEHVFKVFRGQKLISEKVARFRQIKLEQPNAHHDALEFPDGQTVLLTRLCEGQHATVLQLPASPRATTEAKQRKRGCLVT
jgi:hypothetical protein